jgi:hypothetical protein
MARGMATSTTRALQVFCAIGSAASALGQGTVEFANHITGVVITHVYLPLTWERARPLR